MCHNYKRNDLDSVEADQNISDVEETEDYLEFIEDSSESEADIDCISWDCDSKILAGFSTSKGLTGCHLMPTCLNQLSDDQNLNKKKKLSVYLHQYLLHKNDLMKIKSCWIKDEPFINEHIEITACPFKICIVKNLVDDIDFLSKLRNECYDLNFNLRTMDLYEFFQSKDLKYIKSQRVSIIYEFLKGEVMSLVSSITGYEFSNISMTCSLYTCTDYLLVHDDQREDRRVAFILYLTDSYGWQKENGGCLQLLNKNKAGQPLEVVRSIVPSNNQFIFFQVTNDSYHQVEEVINLNKYRLSINGWFHTKEPPVFNIPLYKSPSNSLYSDNYQKPKSVDIDLESWINDEYMEPSIIKSIQKHIEDNSEISLKQFLKAESFGEVLENLNSPDVAWEQAGPPNRLSYETIKLQQMSHVLERLINLFQSTVMFQLLRAYTDLDLTTQSASMKFELQRWSPGNYALLTDYDWKKRNELDLIMYFGCKSRTSVVGARTQYITMEDEIQHALITIEPEDNSLNIVYRDSARFTKYFSMKSKNRCFYILICSYSE